MVEPDGGTIEIAGHRLPRGRSEAMAHVGFAAGYLPLPERLRVVEFGEERPGAERLSFVPPIRGV